MSTPGLEHMGVDDNGDMTDSAATAAATEAASISPRSLARQLNIGNASAMERRIKKELEENGEVFLIVKQSRCPLAAFFLILEL